MTASALRRWRAVHRWSSLICTLFLLMLCLTGLPLIFHDEIDATLNPDTWQPAHPDRAPLALDQILAQAAADQPGSVPLYLSFDVDRPVVNVTTGPRADVAAAEMHFASYDLTSGARVPPADVGADLMHVILQLHTDLFLGLPGMWLLGAMGLLFVVAIVSGVVVYVPFMRRLPFGTLRQRQSARAHWLDHHNLLGVTTVAWALVVGLTGVINAFEQPLLETWRTRELGDLIRQADRHAAPADRRASLDAAVAAAVAEAPNRRLQFVAFPGTDYSTAQHYAIFLHGDTPLTEHLMTPVLVDAHSGHLDGLREMPWYMKALALSRPLHFGDYGGVALKLVWAVLDLITMAVLISGLVLWWRRSRKEGAAYSLPATIDGARP